MKSNYIPDFVDNSGLDRGCGRACCDEGRGARTLRGAVRRHPLGDIRELPQGTLALAGALENESGAGQEPASDLSR